jgi:hypothetical protein
MDTSSGGGGGDGDGSGDGLLPARGTQLAALLDLPRYGIGYALASGLVGVCFNDGSSMVCRPSDAAAESAVTYAPQGSVARAAPLPAGAALPPALQKKLLLLQRFVIRLRDGRPHDSERVGQPHVLRLGPAPGPTPVGGEGGDAPYALCAVRSSEGHVALVFSDRSLHVAFPDATVLVLRPGLQAAAELSLSDPGAPADGGVAARVAEARALLLQMRVPKAAAPASGLAQAEDCAQRDQVAAP